MDKIERTANVCGVDGFLTNALLDGRDDAQDSAKLTVPSTVNPSSLILAPLPRSKSCGLCRDSVYRDEWNALFKARPRSNSGAAIWPLLVVRPEGRAV